MKLIDVDALSELVGEPIEVFLGRLDLKLPPVIDAVPVRHGRWIVEWETEDTRMLRCSECRMVFNVGNGRDGNYCPNCGCRMESE